MKQKIEERANLGPILIRKGQDWYFLLHFTIFVLKVLKIVLQL